MVIEADFVPGVVKTTLKPETGYNFFTFPSVDGSPPSVVAKGNLIIIFRDTPAVRAFVDYLASPESAEIWVGARRLRLAEPNVPRPPIQTRSSRQTSEAMTQAERSASTSPTWRRPRSAARRPGEWKIFQDFLKNPKNIDGTAQHSSRPRRRRTATRA